MVAGGGRNVVHGLNRSDPRSGNDLPIKTGPEGWLFLRWRIIFVSLAVPIASSDERGARLQKRSAAQLRCRDSSDIRDQANEPALPLGVRVCGGAPPIHKGSPLVEGGD